MLDLLDIYKTQHCLLYYCAFLICVSNLKRQELKRQFFRNGFQGDNKDEHYTI